MNMMKRFGALALAFTLSLAALSGCQTPGSGSGSTSGSGDTSSSGDTSQPESMDLSQVTDPYLAVAGAAGGDTVATLGEDEVTAASFLYWFNYTAERSLGSNLTTIPWDADLGGVSMGDYIKDEALEVALFHVLLHAQAREAGLSPDPALAEELNRQFTEAAAQAGDEAQVRHTLWAQLLTPDLLLYYNESSDLYNQLAELYYGENSGSYPTDAEVTAFLDETGVYRAKHILLSTVDENRQPLEDEAVIAQKKSQADELLARLQGAEDPIALFDQLMNEHSEDPGLALNPEGYTTEKGQMVAPFEEAALALKPGEISGVVESELGYHIILRMPIDPAGYRDRMISHLLEERLDQRKQELGVEKTELFSSLDPAAFMPKLSALQTAVYNELTADQTGGASSSGSQG